MFFKVISILTAWSQLMTLHITYEKYSNTQFFLYYNFLIIHQVSHLVQEKYEQREPSGDIFDDYVSFLSGELLDGVRSRNMEVSYTKEQQKQKQKQQNKNKDSDVSEVFDEARQIVLEDEMEDYFKYR